jgi:hypothetical protein
MIFCNRSQASPFTISGRKYRNDLSLYDRNIKNGIMHMDARKFSYAVTSCGSLFVLLLCYSVLRLTLQRSSENLSKILMT